MKNFKKLLEIQKNEAQKIIDNEYYDDREKIERINDLFIGDTDLTALDEFKNHEDLDLMQELRAEARSDFIYNFVYQIQFVPNVNMNNINKIITSNDQNKIDKLEKKATQLLEAKKRGRKTLVINGDEFKEYAKTLTIPELCLKFKCSPAKVANLKQKFQVKRKYLIDLEKVDQLLKNGDTIKEIVEKLGVKRTTLIASLHKLKNFKK